MEEEFMRLRINTTKSTTYFEFNNNIYRLISITRSSYNFIEIVYAKNFSRINNQMNSLMGY